jgi:pyrroloquinoline quinone (PQQ) biosynthesis protein C
MITGFDLTAKPLISSQVSFVETGDELELRAYDATYTYSDRGAQIMAALEHRLDGSSTMAGLAGELGISPESLRNALAVLIDDQLLIDAAIIESAQSPDEVFDAYFSFCKFWMKEIFAQPFWEVMLSGKAGRNLVMGWGIEFYHYTHSANEHMANAVSYCRTDKEARQWLAQHYVEEHDHSEIFLDGLAACGLDREQVRNAPPLPSTRALINFLNELAVSGPLAYLSAFGIMQAPGSGQPGGSYNRFYDMLIKHYGFAAGLFEAYRKHAAIDNNLDHDDILIRRMIVREKEVSPDTRRKMLTAARDTLEYFVLYFEGIYDFYSKPGIIMPRRPLDIRMVL